jgi:hypothetical protein
MKQRGPQGAVDRRLPILTPILQSNESITLSKASSSWREAVEKISSWLSSGVIISLLRWVILPDLHGEALLFKFNMPKETIRKFSGIGC